MNELYKDIIELKIKNLKLEEENKILKIKNKSFLNTHYGLKTNQRLQAEIERLCKRNVEVYREVRDYAYRMCISSIEINIAKKIIQHLATYLLFNTPIRKSDIDDKNI